MKKQILTAVALIATIAMGVTSCGKEDAASPVQVNNEQSATVFGYVVMQDNMKPDVNNKLYYSSPKTLPVSASVAYANGDYQIPAQNISYDSKTGKLTIVSPVDIDGSVVKISIGAIEGTRVQSSTAPSGYSEVTGVWKSNSPISVLSVKAGLTQSFGTVTLAFTPDIQNGSQF